MRAPKFKVGDKVRVLRASTDAEGYLWCDVWFSTEMDEMIGKIYTIKKVYTTECYDYASYSLGGYMLPEFVLQKPLEVGEQLLLFEM